MGRAHDGEAAESGSFGAGYGLLPFRDDEQTEVIRIFDILWIG
jgi:hypothetical protein